jgi:Flp pilus assembly protein TadD/precorrin-6B methylase 2
LPVRPLPLSNGVTSQFRSLVGDGRVAEALRIVDRALAEGTDDPPWRSLRADVLAAWGRESEAARERQVALRSGYRDGSLLRALAWGHLHARRYDEAGEAFRAALERDASDPEARFGCAAVDQSRGRNDLAIAAIEAIAEQRPDDAALVLALARCDLAQGNGARAEARLGAWLARRDGPPDVPHMLGRLLEQTGRSAEATQYFRAAMAVARRDGIASEAFLDLAILACEQADYATAHAILLDNLPSHPLEAGHRLLSHVLLATGAFEEGWRQCEYRWFGGTQASLRPPYRIPVWRGERLAGRTILVHAEQGFGDVIQFARYLPPLKALGAHVRFFPIPGLGGIVARLPGVDEIALDGSAVESVDYYVTLMSLPLAFGTTLATIPPIAPLAPLDAGTVSRWSSRLPPADRLRVAVVWAGGAVHMRDKHRSIALDALAPLVAVPGVEWISLQKGVAAVQAERVPADVAWESLGAELDDFDDTSAVLERVDLLITVDTSIAHLAGTMGVPTWVLVAEPADSRWLVGRTDSPWYPSMRLFRQSAPGAWAPVIERAANELSRLSHAKASGHALAAVEPSAAAARDTMPEPEGRTPHLARVTDTRAGWVQYDPDEERVGVAIESLGEYEEPLASLLDAIARPGQWWLDAGAGVGLRTLRLARRVEAHGHVLAFEPREPVGTMLRQNLAANGVHNVTVLSATLIPPSHRSGRAQDATIDDLGLARLDGVVVDAGLDAQAILRGGEASVWNARPVVLASVADPRMARDAADSLRSMGYRIYRQAMPMVPPSSFHRIGDARLASYAPTWLVVGIPEEREQPALPVGCVEST